MWIDNSNFTSLSCFKIHFRDFENVHKFKKSRVLLIAYIAIKFKLALPRAYFSVGLHVLVHKLCIFQSLLYSIKREHVYH